MSIRRLLAQPALRWATAALLLAVIFTFVPLGEVVTAMGRVAPWTLMLGGILALGGHALGAVRLVQLLQAQGIAVPMREMLGLVLAAQFYGLVLPGGNVTAAAMRFHALARRGADAAAIGLGLLVDRVLATAALALIGVVAGLLATPRPPAPLLLAMAVATLAFLALPLVALLPALARRLPKKAASVVTALAAFRAIPTLDRLVLFGYSIVAQLLLVASYMMVARGLDLPLSWPAVTWTRSAALLVTLVPVSIGGIGVRDGALVLLLSPYGVWATNALAFAFLAFGVTTVLAALIGGLVEARRLLLGAAQGERS